MDTYESVNYHPIRPGLAGLVRRGTRSQTYEYSFTMQEFFLKHSKHIEVRLLDFKAQEE